MRETNRKVSPPPSIPSRRSESSSGTLERGSSAIQVFPRITTPEPGAAPVTAPAETPAAGVDEAFPSRAGAGIFMSYAGLGIAAGAAVLMLIVVAVIAYRSGAEDEKNQLLAARDQSPPSSDNSGVRGSPERPSPTNTPERPASNPDAPSATPRNTGPASPPLPVLDADPRQIGWNYLTIATLFRQDATAAAQFLTDNGVACVVVAPEGKSPEDLLQDRRANWLVVAREGIAPDQYKTPAAQARRSQLVGEVKKLGKRWKQDQKGSSDFADPYWNKFGK